MWKRLTLSEIFLLESSIWLLAWLLNDYLATLLTLIIAPIVLATLIIAGVSELLEPTRISRKYFWIMGISLLSPLLAAAAYMLIFQGKLSFI